MDTGQDDNMSRCSVSLCILLLNVVAVFAVDAINIKVIKHGDDVSLPCKVKSNTSILAVKWTRPDLGAEYVLLNRDGQSDPDNQHPSYKDRVQLKDTQMKDGDVSLILKNMTKDVTGVYLCQVKETNKSRWKTAANMTLDLCTGHTGEDSCSDEHTNRKHYLGALVAGLAFSGVVFVGFGIFMKKNPRLLPPAESEVQLV